MISIICGIFSEEKKELIGRKEELPENRLVVLVVARGGEWEVGAVFKGGQNVQTSRKR